MKRTSMFVLVATLVLGGGNVVKRTARCHGIYGVAWVCSASASPSHAQMIGNAWERGMNLYGEEHRNPYRIKHIVCDPDGEALARCKFAVVDVVKQRVACMSALIATDGRVFQPKTIRCDYLQPTGTTA